MGPVLGVWFAHLMFDLPMLQFSKHVHNGTRQWLADALASFGLLATTFAGIRSADVFSFILTQLAGALLALPLLRPPAA